MRQPERVETIIIGGGQAGLSVGYYLAWRGLPFVILEANQRIGDTWRRRWDSLRLFTPARFDGIAGMPFPGRRHMFPTKDEMADYLERYAAGFKLPVRTGVKVDRLSREAERYVVQAGDLRFEADNVVVAMATYQRPRVPAFAVEVDPGVVQLHSSDYRNPSQLREGGVLIVGAGNSGSEIAREVAQAGHSTWMSGRDTGHVPFRIEGVAGRYVLPLLFRIVFHRILTVDTAIGRMSGAPLETIFGRAFGLHFLYAMSSTMIHGVERDSKHIAETIASRRGETPAARMKLADTSKRTKGGAARTPVRSRATAASAER